MAATVRQARRLLPRAEVRRLRSAIIDPFCATRDFYWFPLSGPRILCSVPNMLPSIGWSKTGTITSYISGIDTATNGSLLLNHKVFMDAGHDEYWTASQVAERSGRHESRSERDIPQR